FGAMDNDTVLYTTDDALPEKITNKLTCPDYWVRRYTHWGNLSSWEISYRRIHPNSSIIECYNALKEDIEILSSIVHGNNNKYRKLESLRIKVKQAVDCERPSASFIILSKELKHVVIAKEIETAEQSSSRQHINQGIEDEDNDQIQDNDFNESESIVHSCKQKRKCPILECNIVVKHSLLKNYCEMLLNLQSHHIDEDSQRARHCLAMLRWSVVHLEIFINAGWENIPKMINISTPRVALNLLTAVFKEHPNDELRSIATILQLLRRQGKICTSDYDMTAILHFLFSNNPRNHYDIDVLTASSAITAVISYTATPVRGSGSNPSENHVKAELWLRIFSTAFKLHKLRFLPVWELQHLVSGNAGHGSARSDFAAIVNNNNDIQFPFFLVEFERNGLEVHKDEIVIVSEAAHEFNRILSSMHYPSENEVNETNLHVGLVNDMKIRFGRLQPQYDENKSLLFYVYDDDVLSFNFHERSTESNVENVLRLVTYLRETVCADGMRIRTLLNRYPAQFNYNLKAALPILPSEAVHSRTFEMKFTPPSKRVKYNIVLEDK
ncbi:16429_t:CDS:2, partial [Cetraspora pellucida]